MYNQIVTDKSNVKRLRKSRQEAGILYKFVRHRLNLTQLQMSKLLGVELHVIVNRERLKRKYLLCELVELQDISGINDVEFWSIVKAVAK